MLSEHNTLSHHLRFFEEKRREKLIDLNQQLKNRESNKDNLLSEVVDMTFLDRYFVE